jgi:hypothetical protein
MAKSRRKIDKYVGKILQITQKVGIYLPNLRNLYQNQKAARGHGAIPGQAQNFRKEHSC